MWYLSRWSLGEIISGSWSGPHLLAQAIPHTVYDQHVPTLEFQGHGVQLAPDVFLPMLGDRLNFNPTEIFRN